MRNVLVVGDQKAIADMYKVIIESIGHKCIVSYDAKDTLKKIKKNKFGLILLDISMPHTTGIDLIKKIKNEQKTSGAKIVFITARIPHKKIVNTLDKLGAKIVPIKPVKKKKMIEKIAQYLNN